MLDLLLKRRVCQGGPNSLNLSRNQTELLIFQHHIIFNFSGHWQDSDWPKHAGEKRSRSIHFPLMMPKTFKLFALGSNGSGQLGIGHQDDTATPQLCKFDNNDIESINEDDSILKTVAGGNHTLVLFKSGDVFAAGSNEHGQCYLPSLARTSMFRRVSVLDRHLPDVPAGRPTFVDISATWEASFLLDTNGRVYCFGTGLKGELGCGDRLTGTDECQVPLSAFRGGEIKITKLYSGMRHTIAIGEDGVYGWGSCRKGELGADLEHRKEIWNPQKLSVTFEPQKAILGRSFTILFGAGDCIVFGRDQALRRIAELEHSHSQASEAGWSTAYVLADGRVEAFGRNDRGQWPSESLPHLSALAAGSEHCLGLTKDGQVVAWGWGEHGNCGQPTDRRGNVAGGWNVLPVPLEDDEEIVHVAAGCATSFVAVEKKRR